MLALIEDMFVVFSLLDFYYFFKKYYLFNERKNRKKGNKREPFNQKERDVKECQQKSIGENE